MTEPGTAVMPHPLRHLIPFGPNKRLKKVDRGTFTPLWRGVRDDKRKHCIHVAPVRLWWKATKGVLFRKVT